VIRQIVLVEDGVTWAKVTADPSNRLVEPVDEHH
jgi:hypothetical protein